MKLYYYHYCFDYVCTVEPQLSDIRLTDLPGYPTYHTESSTPRYLTKI